MRGRQGEEEKKGGRKEGRKDRGKEERNLRLSLIYFPLSKTQAGCHSIKAITLALLAILEIKVGLLKLTVHSEASGIKANLT